MNFAFVEFCYVLVTSLLLEAELVLQRTGLGFSVREKSRCFRCVSLNCGLCNIILLLKKNVKHA